MNKLREAVVVAGISSGLLAAGCGESGIEQEAQIVGFGNGIDVEVIEPQWQTYTDQEHLPGGEIRNVQINNVQDGCREVSNGFFSSGMDHPDCWLDFTCTSSDGTHCEPIYENRYTYQRLEDTIVRECLAPIIRREFKGDPVKDTSCEEALGPNQRVREAGRYVLWVTTPNPNSEDGDRITGRAEVTAEEWRYADRSEPVTVTIKDGRVVDIEVTG